MRTLVALTSLIMLTSACSTSHQGTTDAGAPIDAGALPTPPRVDSGPPGRTCDVAVTEVPAESFATCDEHWHATVRELGRLQRCERNEDCGQSLRTGCGCTRSLVGRCDVDRGRFEMLVGTTPSTCITHGFLSWCDCPPADGVVCVAGRCEWNYEDEPTSWCPQPGRMLGVWPELPACICGLGGHPYAVEFDVAGAAVDARDARPGADSPWSATTRDCVLAHPLLTTRCYPLLAETTPRLGGDSCTP